MYYVSLVIYLFYVFQLGLLLTFNGIKFLPRSLGQKSGFYCEFRIDSSFFQFGAQDKK
jgi:hypothetical protein